ACGGYSNDFWRYPCPVGRVRLDRNVRIPRWNLGQLLVRFRIALAQEGRHANVAILLLPRSLGATEGVQRNSERSVFEFFIRALPGTSKTVNKDDVRKLARRLVNECFE